MPSVYKIIFVNERGSDGDYAFFAAPPIAHDLSNSPEVYTNAWITQFVPESGTFTIQTTKQFYAWAGTVPSTPVPGTVINGGVAKLAELGTSTSPGSAYQMVIKEGTPKLQGPTLNSSPSAFEIDCGNDFPNPNINYLIGMGMTDSNGVVTPVASILAPNGSNVQITPIMKFYIGQYSFEAGSVVDFQTISAHCATIDFSDGPGYGKYTAIVRQDSYAKWSVAYTSSAQTATALQAIADGKLGSYLDLKNPFDPAIEADKIVQLESQIMALSALFQSISVADPQAIRYWKGILNWPAAAPLAVIAAGATIVAGYLIHKNYTVSYTTKPTLLGQETTFTITPPSKFYGILRGEVDPVDPVHDWVAAVAADTNNDGHMNGGITSSSTMPTQPVTNVKTGAPNALTESRRQQLLNGN